MDILGLEPHGLLGKPEKVVQRDVRLHVLREDLGEGADFGPVAQLQALLRQGHQEGLLHLHPGGVAVVGAVVVLPPAHHLHGVLAAEEAVAFLLVDVEVLVGVVVVHVEGHVKIHAPQRLHDLAHRLPLDDDIEIRHHAGEVLHLGLESVHPQFGGIDGVDLLDIPGHIDHGVPGNAHHVHLLVGHVVGGQDNGVRAAAGGVLPQEKECKVIFLSAAYRGRLILGIRFCGCLLVRPVADCGLGLVTDVRRLDKDGPPQSHRQGQRRHAAHHNDRDPLPAGEAELLPAALPGEGVPLRMPRLPHRLTLAFLSAHDMIPFK